MSYLDFVKGLKKTQSNELNDNFEKFFLLLKSFKEIKYQTQIYSNILFNEMIIPEINFLFELQFKNITNINDDEFINNLINELKSMKEKEIQKKKLKKY